MNCTRVRFRLLLALLLLAATSQVASADHFAAGTISWQQDPTYYDGVNVKIHLTFNAEYRWSTLAYAVGMNPPVGTIIPDEEIVTLTGAGFNDSFDLPVLVTSISPAEDRMTVTGSTDVLLPISSLPVTFSLAGCCRLDAFGGG